MMGSLFGCKKDIAITASNCSLLIDVAKEASSEFLSDERIQEKIDSYAEMGIREITLIPIPDGYVATESCQGSVICDASITSDHMLHSVRATLDPNLSFIVACKNAGMNVTVMYKPYEGGGSITIPYPDTQFSFAEMTTLGGTAVFCLPEFEGRNARYISSLDLESGKSMGNQPISSLELVFAVEAFQNLTAQNTNTKIKPNANANLTPQLWGAKSDNMNYTELTDITFSVKKEARTLTDATGNSLEKKECMVLTIDVSAYSLYKYFAVSFENGNELYTIPFSMINGYAADGTELITTKSVYSRNPNTEELISQSTVPSNYIWGTERKPILTTDQRAKSAFRAFGFEFGYGGIGSDFGDGWHNAYVYGIALGSQNYLRGNLCEADESVRNYWLGQIDRFYARGADTVIVSLENWGGGVYDYTQYGYNYKYVKEMKELYGIDILTESFDYLKLMELRGKYFSEFLQSVATLADENGKQWGIELFSSFASPALDDDLNSLCHYRMPKILFDWKTAVDACDTVLIKDYIFGKYQKNFAKDIRDYADNAGKNVLVMGYTSCNVTDTYIQKALQDDRNDRIVLDSATTVTQLFQK